LFFAFVAFHCLIVTTRNYFPAREKCARVDPHHGRSSGRNLSLGFCVSVLPLLFAVCVGSCSGQVCRDQRQGAEVPAAAARIWCARLDSNSHRASSIEPLLHSHSILSYPLSLSVSLSLHLLIYCYVSPSLMHRFSFYNTFYLSLSFFLSLSFSLFLSPSLSKFFLKL
jgi:hypothetical protein